MAATTPTANKPVSEMTAAELLAHIEAKDTAHKNEMKALKALHRVYELDPAKK